MSAPEQPDDGPKRLLLVDDELDLLCVLSDILQSFGFAVVSTWEGEDAVRIASIFKPDILVTDFRLPGIDGVTTIQRIREELSDQTRAILVSAYVSTETRQRALQQQVERILEKPVSVTELVEQLRDAQVAQQALEDARASDRRYTSGPGTGT